MTAFEQMITDIGTLHAGMPTKKFKAILAGEEIVAFIRSLIRPEHKLKPDEIRTLTTDIDLGFVSIPIFDKSQLFPRGSTVLCVIETDDPATPYTLIMRKEHQ